MNDEGRQNRVDAIHEAIMMDRNNTYTNPESNRLNPLETRCSDQVYLEKLLNKQKQVERIEVRPSSEEIAYLRGKVEAYERVIHCMESTGWPEEEQC